MVLLSRRMFAFSTVVAAVFAFIAGRMCRYVGVNDSKLLVRFRDVLSEIVISSKKEAVNHSYSWKKFELNHADSSKGCADNGKDGFFAISPEGHLSKEHVTTQASEEPVSQHLLVDIKNVDGSFLKSKERLQRATVSLVSSLVDTVDATLQYFGCKDTETIPMSCLGILYPAGHIYLHTWPNEGILALDLYTRGSASLLHLVPNIEKLFAVPAQAQASDHISKAERPHVQWAQKERGFHKGNRRTNVEDMDFVNELLGWNGYELKENVVSVETDIQTMDIYDVIDPRRRSLQSFAKTFMKDGSYESLHPELFQPDRVLYLDLIEQSRRYGEAAYHEALVHPAMFAHEEPRRVAIIGGGEGATLREVLKHKTVEKVTMVEIDEQMVNLSRTHLPEWSNCSGLVGSAPSCFDDPRAEVYYTDAIAWFVDRFSEEEEIDEAQKYDVIILDALDPTSFVDFSDDLYDNSDFVDALYNALTESGILVAQLGEEDHPTDLPRKYSTAEQLQDMAFMQHLQEEGFEKIKEYSEGHGGFEGVWSYLIAFKDGWTNDIWYANEAFFSLAMQQRLLPTTTGESSLRYFDGASMMSYAYPSRIVADTFCLDNSSLPYCEYGHGFDPEQPNVAVNSLQVRESSIPGAGLGLFFKESFPKGAYFAIDEGVHVMQVRPPTLKAIKAMLAANVTNAWRALEYYLLGYGVASDFYGDEAYLVDPGIITFANHGCNATYNIGFNTSVTEFTADPFHVPEEIDNDVLETYVYNPLIDRNHHQYLHLGEDRLTLREVTAGEEVLTNYLPYFSSSSWERRINEPLAMCSNRGSGLVMEYERRLETSLIGVLW